MKHSPCVNLRIELVRLLSEWVTRPATKLDNLSLIPLTYGRRRGLIQTSYLPLMEKKGHRNYSHERHREILSDGCS